MEPTPALQAPKGPLHPSVLRVIEELGCPSPGVCPKDPEQPRQGSLRELQLRLDHRRRTDSCMCVKSKEILDQVKLDNPSLVPAAVGWHKALANPSMSGILQRRKGRRLTEISVQIDPKQ